MNRRTIFAAILALAFAVCFAAVSQVQADCRSCRYNLKCPTWKIFRDGSAMPVNWLCHEPNPRFCTYDPENNSTDDLNTWVDDLVLDRETCLIWERVPEYNEQQPRSWFDAVEHCYQQPFGSRMGGRQPTIEELTSLFDATFNGFALPDGHPFHPPFAAGIWSGTTHVGDTDQAWAVSFGATFFHKVDKNKHAWAWCVRGGHGYDGY